MSSWYCPLPFKHAFVDSTGVSACCQTPRKNVSISEWINSDYLHTFQQQILSGNVPAECHECVKQEKIRGTSLRLDSINDYSSTRFTTTDIDFIDYRSNNVCNFKCRSCNPRFSHGILNEVKNHESLRLFYNTHEGKVLTVDQQNVQWLYDNIDVIKKLMITGGEPTLMPEVKKLVERVVYDKLDVTLLITTNASFTDDFWCEATRLHSKIHWTVSLDGVGAAAELIRSGTDWAVVERNARWLAQHAPSMNVNTVVSNLNVLQLEPLLKFVIDLQRESRYPRGLHGQGGCRHQFHVIGKPNYLAADNWPAELQSTAIKHLESCVLLPLDIEQKNLVQGLMKAISQSLFDQNLWNTCQKFNQELNTIRNQDHTFLYNQGA